MESIKNAVNDGISKVKGSFDDTFADRQDAMAAFMNQAKQQYEDLKSKSGEEAENMKKKLKEMNDAFAAKMQKLKEDSRKQMDAKYEEYMSQGEDVAADKVEDLKGQFSAMVQKYGTEGTAAYEDAMKKIQGFNGTSKADVEKWYKEMGKSVDDVQGEALSKLEEPQ